MIEITAERAIEVLAEVVAEHGEDHVYEGPDGAIAPDTDCKYVHGDKPGCIVGHALHRLGIPLDRLETIEHRWATSDTLAEIGVQIFDDPELDNPFVQAQGSQDGGDTWGEALAEARQAVSS